MTKKVSAPNVSVRDIIESVLTPGPLSTPESLSPRGQCSTPSSLQGSVELIGVPGSVGSFRIPGSAGTVRVVGHNIRPAGSVGNGSWSLVLACAFCLAAGVTNIVVGKLQNRHKSAVCPTCESRYFEQPFLQTFFMFIAESLCLVAHGLDLLYRKRVLKLPRGYGKFEFIDPPSSALLYRVTPWWWFALPSLCDILGTATINFAFTMTYASTVQLLRNSVMIFTALNTLVVMRRPLLVCEWTGIIIMTLGMVIAGAESLRNPEAESNHSGSAVLGIILTLLGTSLNACTLIFEEALLKKRYSPPLRAVGFAGITGIMWNLVALPIAHVCKIQNLEHGWHQLLSSATLKGSVMAFICSSFIFNSTGMFVTQLGSGLLKGLLYSCRAPIIWVVEILLRWQAYNRFGLIGLIATFGGFIVFTNVLKLGSFWTTPVGCGLTPKRPSVVLIPPSI